MSENENKSSWSIRRKLAGIMLVTILGFLSGMIFMATYFFRKDVENRVKENAIQVAISLGAKTKSDFTLIIEKINLMLSLSKETPDSKIDSLNFEKVFFQNDKYFLMIGIFSKENQMITESEILFNEEALVEFNLNKEMMLNIAKTNENFSKAFSGNVSLENISPELGITSFAISFPFKDRKDKCIIAILHTKKILETFEKKMES